MYKDEYHPRIKKDLKKIDPGIRENIKEIQVPAILADPSLGQKLVGDFAGINSYHFTIARQQYRIAYVTSEEEKKVFVLMIAKREGFYKILKRRS